MPNLSNIPTAVSKTATAVILQEVCSKVSEVAVDTSTESISRKVVDTSKTNKSLAEATRRNLRTKTLGHAQSAVQSQAKRAEEPRTTVPPLDKVPKLDRKHVPTQEEMLIEAANATEAENERWILARQRFAARGGDGSTTSNKPSKKNNAVSTNRQVIQRLHCTPNTYELRYVYYYERIYHSTGSNWYTIPVVDILEQVERNSISALYVGTNTTSTHT